MKPNTHPVVVHVINTLQGGGTERMLVELLRAMDPAMFRHVVVCLRGAGVLAECLPDHIACRAMGAHSRSWWAGLKLAALNRRWRATLIHARNTGCWHDACVAAVLTPGARLVLGFHGLERPGPLSARHRRLARWAACAGVRFTSVSEAGRRQLIEEARVPASRVTVLRNGVDWALFQRGACFAPGRTGTAPTSGPGLDRRSGDGWSATSCPGRQMSPEPGRGAPAFVVGTVGSLTPVKRHATLISAVASAALCAPNIRLLIAGEGPLRTALTQQATAQGIGDKVRLLGWCDDVAGFLHRLDAYVCSSASEGMSNALLEAMAAGLPVIATRVGDNAILVRDAIEGCIVEPDREELLAQALVGLASSAEMRRRLGVAARDRAKEYSFERMVRAYQDYYEALATADTSFRPALLGAGTRPATPARGPRGGRGGVR